MEKDNSNSNTTGGQIRKYVFLEKFERTKTAIKEQFKTVDKKIDLIVSLEAKANTSWTSKNRTLIDANSKRINELNKAIKVNRIISTAGFMFLFSIIIFIIFHITTNL